MDRSRMWRSLGYALGYLTLWIGLRFYLRTDPWVALICRPWILLPVCLLVALIPFFFWRSEPRVLHPAWWMSPRLNRAVAIWLTTSAFYLLPDAIIRFWYRGPSGSLGKDTAQLLVSPLVFAVLSLGTPVRYPSQKVEAPSHFDVKIDRWGSYVQAGSMLLLAVFLAIAIIACTEPAKDGSSNLGFMFFFGLCLVAACFRIYKIFKTFRNNRAVE